MDIRKVLLLQSLRELLTTTACFSRNKKKSTVIQEEEIRMSINLPYVEGTSEKLGHIPRSHNKIHFPLPVNHLINQKIE